MQQQMPDGVEEAEPELIDRPACITQLHHRFAVIAIGRAVHP